MSDLKEQLKLLMAQRDILQIEADAIHSELTSHGLNGEPPAGINDSLVDSEGFPRGDIDLFNVKTKRARLRAINNDYKAIMKQIENLMPRIYAELSTASDNERAPQSSVPHSTSSAVTERVSQHREPDLRPIARIDEVLAQSPAEEAGLVDGDMLVKFAHISSNHDSGFSFIPGIVRESVGKPIILVILRNGERTEVFITPRTWGGRGLLGCHLTPIC